MKLKETADLLDHLAAGLESFLKTGALTDLRAVSGCLRQFGDEPTSTFCQFVVKAKEGKAPSGNGRAVLDDNKIAAIVNDIKNFLDHRETFDYGAIERMVAPIQKLKNAEIEAIGQQIRCPVKGKKSEMIKELQNWLTNIKASDVQSSFSLVGSGVSAKGY